MTIPNSEAFRLEGETTTPLHVALEVGCSGPFAANTVSYGHLTYRPTARQHIPADRGVRVEVQKL